MTGSVKPFSRSSRIASLFQSLAYNLWLQIENTSFVNNDWKRKTLLSFFPHSVSLPKPSPRRLLFPHTKHFFRKHQLHLPFFIQNICSRKLPYLISCCLFKTSLLRIPENPALHQSLIGRNLLKSRPSSLVSQTKYLC